MERVALAKSLVSCITPFWNLEKFLAEAIESVLSQTYNNWELLLVDDGSTDGSSEIARRYAEKYPEKIRYLEHENHRNLGISTSRNLGISQAKGEYTAHLDADDIWMPDKLEKQVAILEANPEAGMVYGNTKIWYSWTGLPRDAARDQQLRLLNVQDTLIFPPTMVSLLLEGKSSSPGIGSILARHELVKQIGAFEDQFKGLYEDQVFIFKFCLRYPVFVASGCWDWYRQHPESICSKGVVSGEYNPMMPHSAQHTFLSWFEHYLLLEKITDERVHRSLKIAFRPYRYPHCYYLLGFIRRAIGWLHRNIKILLRFTRV